MTPRLRRRARRGGPEGQGGAGAYPQRIHRFVEPALLLLLHFKPNHGYGLIDGLERVGFGDYPVDPSAIYRVLRQLEAQGMVTSSWDTESTAGPPRRVYCLTEAGDRYLAAWVADLRATDRILHCFLDAYNAHMEESKGEYHR